MMITQKTRIDGDLWLQVDEQKRIKLIKGNQEIELSWWEIDQLEKCQLNMMIAVMDRDIEFLRELNG